MKYDFRLKPEAIWFVVNTVVATALIDIVATDFSGMTDWRGWAAGFAISLLSRTLPAALLAAATGSFQKNG